MTSLTLQEPRRLGWYWAGFAGTLAVSLLVHLPLVLNFQFFAFYDPGTALHAVELLARGYRPTIDFGYTHGLLALEFSRAWLGLWGATPAAYVAGVCVLQVFIALGLARLARSFAFSARATLLLCLLLPWAIIPDYLTLTHPLEAALLVHALADHAAGKRPRALALLTLCVLVKPSMAYVYGFVLVVLLVHEHLWTRRPLAWPARLGGLTRVLLPATIVGALALAWLLLRYGALPVRHTLLAVAGTSAYKETNFGLFLGDGRTFWLPHWPLPSWSTRALGANLATRIIDYAAYYLLTPAGLWLLAVITLLLAAARSLLRRNRQSALDNRQFLLTLAILHTAFILGFYGWRMSWTYYAYMPFLALVLIAQARIARRSVWIALCVLAALMHTQRLGQAVGAWQTCVRTPETGGLFAWPDQAAAWHAALQATGGRPTLLMTNGYPPYLPPNVRIPDAWFPETGIATPAEVARVAAQARQAEVVITWWEYGRLDLWNTPEFAPLRREFEPAPGTPFTVWRRH